MSDKVVEVGVANDGKLSLLVEDVKLWEPKKISYFIDTTIFKNGDTYYSMKTVDFKEIFKL